MYERAFDAGTIVNVETLDVKFDDWQGSVDPDESFHKKSTSNDIYHLNVIRLFYKKGPAAVKQTIGE